MPVSSDDTVIGLPASWSNDVKHFFMCCYVYACSEGSVCWKRGLQRGGGGGHSEVTGALSDGPGTGLTEWASCALGLRSSKGPRLTSCLPVFTYVLSHMYVFLPWWFSHCLIPPKEPSPDTFQISAPTYTKLTLYMVRSRNRYRYSNAQQVLEQRLWRTLLTGSLPTACPAYFLNHTGPDAQGQLPA